MNANEKLSLAEAIAKIREIAEDAMGERYQEDRVIDTHGTRAILDILSRVDPDEEGQAVLWLMRKKGWTLKYSKEQLSWLVDEDFQGMRKISPIDEAKKLGWGG